MLRPAICIWASVSATLLSGNAGAYPDGAPWGAAIATAAEHCATCHFDGEPVHDSPLLRIEGLPEHPAPGKAYELTIHFDDPAAVAAGFQLIAEAGDDQAGSITSVEANLEFIDSAIRSTVPKKNGGAVAWTVKWQAPSIIRRAIHFFVAAAAANGDQSPLGDTIHFASSFLPPPAAGSRSGFRDDCAR